jgi:predicted dehydrogenase
MATRREFIATSAAAAAAIAARPLYAWQGANNRIRMGVIGMGTRAARVFDSLTRNQDCQFTVGCEVVQAKLQGFQSANRPLAQIPIVGDYRRVLDRNDIDAVLIATPDFSHAKITADALAAGKHVYVEKPISNSIPRVNMMLDAYNKYNNLVVQVGTHQRSWDHFIEAKKLLEEKLDPVTHVLIQQPGAYSANKQDPVPVPAGVDWDAWQVDAPKKAFKQGYLGFRGWWEYGSGLVGDWGAHHVDVANWFMNADSKQPLKTSAVGFYSNPMIDPECVFNQFSIAWQFDDHMLTFANSVYPRPNFNDPKTPDIEGWGVFFYAGNGTLQVNRMGYALRPAVGPTRNRVGPEAPPGAGNVQLGTAPAAAAPAAAGATGAGGAAGGGGRGGGRRGGGAGAPAGAGAPGGAAPAGGPGGGRGGGGGKPPVEMNVYINPRGGVEEDYPLHVHTRDFLDKLKAKNRKTNAPMEIGYNSALPCLLALEAMQTNKVLAWDPVAKKTKAL